MKKPRVDADMEISAIETPSWKSIEQLDTANKTLHRLLEKFHWSLRQSPMPQNSTASGTSESTLRCTRAAKIISGKWVLKPHKARCVLRGFEEDVKVEDVVASTTMTASVRMLLSPATDLRNERYTVFTTDVQTAFSRRTHEGQ